MRKRYRVYIPMPVLVVQKANEPGKISIFVMHSHFVQPACFKSNAVFVGGRSRPNLKEAVLTT